MYLYNIKCFLNYFLMNNEYLLFLISVTAQREDFDCPDNFGFYPHYRSCDKYWACENGTASLKVCGNGLVFDDADPLRENCAYPFSVNCGDRSDLGKWGFVFFK